MVEGSSPTESLIIPSNTLNLHLGKETTKKHESKSISAVL